MPVVSDHPFEDATNVDAPTLEPFETERRIFHPVEPSNCVLDEDMLCWVRDKWVTAGELLTSNTKFYTALKAFDAATVRGRTSSSLLALWGGLEQLFAPSPGELKFRVSALLASYLESEGRARFDRYKDILDLYNKRSTAAHTAKEIEIGPLAGTYVLMRNALLRMINENKVPTQADLEAMLFGITGDTA